MTLPQWKAAAFPLTGSLESLAAREVRRYVVLMLLVLGTLAAAMVVAVRSVARELALSRLRADFVASVSHELKTPLALIRMFAENLRSGWVTEEKRDEYYEVLMRESERLSGLINNVLDFSRMEAGTRRYEMIPTDVRQLLGEILDRYRHHLAAKGIDLVEDLPSAPVQASVDRQAIEQVVINLLSNAAKYIREDERQITVSLTATGDRVLISIADTGIGLTDDQRAHIFDRFYRADDPRARAVAGSGIGLTLVRHIVEAHRGEIRVDSAVNRGSTFTIVLPVLGTET